jgi:hypothetical protein
MKKISFIINISTFGIFAGCLIYSISFRDKSATEVSEGKKIIPVSSEEQKFKNNRTTSTQVMQTSHGSAYRNELPERPQKLFRKSQALKESYVRAFEAKTYMNNVEFFHEKGLSSEVFESVVAAITKRERIWADLQVLAAEKDISSTDPEVVKLDSDARKELNATLLSLLGETCLADFQKYQKESGVRGRVHNFAYALAMQGSPLEDRQFKLVQSLLIETKFYDVADKSKDRKKNLEDLSNSLQSILSEKQFDYFKFHSLATQPPYP